MSRVGRLGFSMVASGLAAMSALACSGLDKTVPCGQPCGPGDECEAGSLCFEGVCRQVCNGHQDCAKMEACEPGVCIPVADFECDEDTDCSEPSTCEISTGAACYAGKCHYNPVEEGSFCEDGNPCTSNDRCDSHGTCSGEEMVCDAPPADYCWQDDSVFRDYESTGACNPSSGLCEYEYVETGCANCGHECLHLPYAPESVVASAGDAQVTLTWDAKDGALSYAVYVSQTEGEAASAEPVSAASSPYAATGLSNGTTYYFAVSAIVEAGEGDLSDEVSTTPRISVPAQVRAVGGDQKVTLSWDAVSGADA